MGEPDGRPGTLKAVSQPSPSVTLTCEHCTPASHDSVRWDGERWSLEEVGWPVLSRGGGHRKKGQRVFQVGDSAQTKVLKLERAWHVVERGTRVAGEWGRGTEWWVSLVVYQKPDPPGPAAVNISESPLIQGVSSLGTSLCSLRVSYCKGVYSLMRPLYPLLLAPSAAWRLLFLG